MAPPQLQSLESFSDVQFRDVVHRRSTLVAPTANVIQKTYHHIDENGNVALSGAEMLTTDANGNVQYALMLGSNAHTLDANVITLANAASWSANSVFTANASHVHVRAPTLTADTIECGTLSLSDDVTFANVTASKMTVTGDLSIDTTTFTVDSVNNQVNLCEASIVRTFLKTLGGGAGNVTQICTISAPTDLGFTGQLHIVQDKRQQMIFNLCVGVGGGSTGGTWQRLIPFCRAGNSTNVSYAYAVDINVDTSTDVCTLRLYRRDNGSTGGGGDIQCTLHLYQTSRDSRELAIEDSTVTLVDEPPATEFFGTTVLSQLNGNVGIGTDLPQYDLDVVGTARVDDLVVANDMSGSGNINISGQFQGASVDTSLLTVSGETSLNGTLLVSGDSTFSNTVTAGNLSTSGQFTATGTNLVFDNMVSLTVNRQISGSTIGSGVGILQMNLAGVGANVSMIEIVLTTHGSSDNLAKHYKFPVVPSVDSLRRVLPQTTRFTSQSDVGIDAEVVSNILSLHLVRTRLSTIFVNTTQIFNLNVRIFYNKNSEFSVEDVVASGFSSSYTSPFKSEDIGDKSNVAFGSALTQISRNVGINTQYPSYNLQVNGDAGISDNLWIGNVSTQSGLLSVAGTILSTDVKTGNATAFTQSGFGTLNFANKWRLAYNESTDSLDIQRSTDSGATWTTTAILAT